jgi:hypothetical protein
VAYRWRECCPFFFVDTVEIIPQCERREDKNKKKRQDALPHLWDDNCPRNVAIPLKSTIQSAMKRLKVRLTLIISNPLFDVRRLTSKRNHPSANTAIDELRNVKRWYI